MPINIITHLLKLHIEMKPWIKILLLIVMTYLGIRVLNNQVRNYIIFLPQIRDRHAEEDLSFHARRLSQLYGVPMTLEEFNVPSADGAVINGLYLHHPNSPNCILYSHGNAGHLYHRLAYLYQFGHLGSILMYDYRGYGKSTGSPTPNGVKQDAFRVWQYLTQEKQWSPHQITIFGESLGSSISSWLASQLVKNPASRPHALIMLSGFACLKSITQHLHGKILAHFMNNDLNSRRYLQEVGATIPVLIYHSIEDELIPYFHHRLLLEANPHAQHHPITGLHSDVPLDEAFMERFATFLYAPPTAPNLPLETPDSQSDSHPETPPRSLDQNNPETLDISQHGAEKRL